CPSFGPVTELAMPRLRGAVLLPAQRSGPTTVFASTRAASSPLFDTSTGPVTWLLATSTPALPETRSGPTTVLLARKRPAAPLALIGPSKADRVAIRRAPGAT